jgi:nucleolar protein 4
LSKRASVIEPDSVEAKYLHKSDLEARESSYTARKGLLRTNPSLYISRTRLSVRQIPLFVTDTMLKRLALHALKAFESETRKGSRKGLTEDELRPEEALDADGKAVVLGQKAAPKAKEKNGKVIPPSRIAQAKILRQTDKADAVSGLGKSKGYGFLELNVHGDALKILRWLNGNAEVAKLVRDWQKDELVKDVKKLEGKKDRTESEDERLERLSKKLEELTSGVKDTDKDSEARMSRTLIVEFSVEYVSRTSHPFPQSHLPGMRKRSSVGRTEQTSSAKRRNMRTLPARRERRMRRTTSHQQSARRRRQYRSRPSRRRSLAGCKA